MTNNEPTTGVLARQDGTETQAIFGAVNVYPYPRAGVSLESRLGRLRVVITTEDRPDAPSDARASVTRRVLRIRADRLPQLIARLQAAHDTAIRLGMKKGGGLR